MISRGGSTIEYTSYNLPKLINSGSNSSAVLYGAFRNRYQQIAVSGGTTETTLYVAGLFEKVTRPGGSIEYRHYIPGGNGTAAIHTRRSSGTNSTYYWHADHLGSPELFTDSSGAALVRPSFGAFGERRDGSDWSGAPSAGDMTAIANITRRGFTGHEHLDSVGLIHMNGRVYDPGAGRFLSVDPILSVGISQDVNSYNYAWNSPLNVVDPSGLDDVVVDNCIDWCGAPAGPTLGGPRTYEPPPMTGPNTGEGMARNRWNGALHTGRPEMPGVSSTVGGTHLDTCALMGGGDGGNAARAGCYFAHDPNISRETKLTIGVGGMALLTGGALVGLLTPTELVLLGVASAPSNLADGLPPFLPSYLRAAGAPFSKILSFTPRSLQKGFTKHAADFGLSGNWNPSRAAEFSAAINKHINAPGVQTITGSYRGQAGFVHHLDPGTGLNVVTDMSGNYVTGFRLGGNQLSDLLSTGGFW